MGMLVIFYAVIHCHQINCEDIEFFIANILHDMEIISKFGHENTAKIFLFPYRCIFDRWASPDKALSNTDIEFIECAQSILDMSTPHKPPNAGRAATTPKIGRDIQQSDMSFHSSAVHQSGSKNMQSKMTDLTETFIKRKTELAELMRSAGKKRMKMSEVR